MAKCLCDFFVDNLYPDLYRRAGVCVDRLSSKNKSLHAFDASIKKVSVLIDVMLLRLS